MNIRVRVSIFAICKSGLRGLKYISINHSMPFLLALLLDSWLIACLMLIVRVVVHITDICMIA